MALDRLEQLKRADVAALTLRPLDIALVGSAAVRRARWDRVDGRAGRVEPERVSVAAPVLPATTN